jgi:hypothetical protein
MLADDAVGADELASNAVVTASILADAVTGAKIADDQIDSEHYVDGSIDTAHLANDCVTPSKLGGIARGKMIIGDSNGDPAAIAVGSADYVLTSDGTDIAWAAGGLGATAVSAAKSWCIFNGTGTISLTDSFGIGSITDYGTGNYKQTFSTALDNTTHVTVTGHHHQQGTNGQYDTHIDVGTRATNSTRFTTSEAGTNYDCDAIFLATFGDS